MARAEKKNDAPFDRPAVIDPERHVLANPGAPERWQIFRVKDDHPLTRAYEKGQLGQGRRDFSARERYEAGLIFRSLYEDVNGSGVASSNLDRVSGAAIEARTAERICDARGLLKRLEDSISADNTFILRRVCGDGAWPSEVVREKYPDGSKHVAFRFCIALDDLIDAILKTKIGRLTK